MAISLNQVILLGNVGKKPEIRVFQDGGLMADFSLATTYSYKPKGKDEYVDVVDWHRVRAYQNVAKTIESYVDKGHKIQVIGQVKNNNYEDKNGVKQYGYYILAERVILLEKSGAKSEPQPQNVENPESMAFNDVPDIPF
ncbi:single-stranded DNA-binding protein [Bisgaard Taxon 10/6]|uniref:single-stranded DNA-binding protein n=1 Tax=Exercitatus varius TaxID=67857 RepID=UPI00294B004C|nr:single-stranded DNA-binding protein [Exercitatus varius]MDG2957056.1 single-stranded DNA-binding protein [Exercitatus varius]MDG2965256.1 single-stranded DNA-binding protein [Exercitatus varius]